MEVFFLLGILLFVIAEVLVIVFSVWLFGLIFGAMIIVGRNTFAAKTRARMLLAVAYLLLCISASVGVAGCAGFKLSKYLLRLFVFG